MGKISNYINSQTERIESAVGSSKILKTVGDVTSTAKDIYDASGNLVLLSLAKAWIGIGTISPASTDSSKGVFDTPNFLKKKNVGSFERIDSNRKPIDRFNYSELYSLQLDDYYLPLSQTFSIQARKRTNVSSLVDGIDIIQQSRKESKVINCSMRISLRDNQPNLQVVTRSHQGDDIRNSFGEKEPDEIISLSRFLQRLYEEDLVFEVANDMINNTFGVTHAFMTSYDFKPRVGMGTYTFDFTLTEVIYGENVLTFDMNEISDDTSENQIGG